jgi:two-component system chemotaxis sensor kinase CheA
VTRAVRELDRLLAGEVERWLKLVERPDAPMLELRAALHSLKGSAGLAGYPELSLVIGQVSARLREKDPNARAELLEILQLSHGRLLAGEPPLPTVWPEPPLGLQPTAVEPRYQADYRAAMRDRLEQIDRVLDRHDSAVEGLEQAQRSVHAMKGAASAVGDDVTAWYCHGLEARLRAAARTEPSAHDVLVELGRHRALLALMHEDAGRGLAALDALAQSAARGREPPIEALGSRPRTAPPAQNEPPPDTAFYVPSSAIERLLERLDRVELVHDELGRSSLLARRVSSRLRDVRASITEALRVLGPARPWGPPLTVVNRLESAAAALRSMSGSTDRGAHSFRASADFLRARSDEMRGELSSLRRTSMGAVFERVAHAGLRLAEAESKQLRVEISGADFTIDRRVADRLYDALVQLVRNAVAHGIQRPDQRVAQGKPSTGTLSLRAERRSEWLRVVVEDDGQGADVARIRELSVQRGAMSRENAESLSEKQLLALLFLPGLTTHTDPGLLAGRGLGLDLVQEAARGLGGVVRLESGAAGGLAATFEIPSDQALMEVLWVEEAGFELALPVSFTRGVRPADPSKPVPRLATCLGEARLGPSEIEVELAVYGAEAVRIGVDHASGIEEVTVRPIPELLARSGPFNGAILRSDGSLRLALDVPVLAARAWAAA